jgi:hypothetical protein
MLNKCKCIKNYYNSKYNQKFLIFRKNEIYEYTDTKFISRKYPDGVNVKFSNGEYIYFRKNETENEYDYDLFKEYFKTLKQFRKEKLNKIYDR